MPAKTGGKKRRASQTNDDLEICFDCVVGDDQPIRLERAAILKVNKWPDDHRVINCRFLDGDPTQRKNVEAKAHIWEDYTNIKFGFGTRSDAEIRISFSLPGSSSAVGTDALNEKYFPKHKPTMNFGLLTKSCDDLDPNRNLLLNLGHHSIEPLLKQLELDRQILSRIPAEVVKHLTPSEDR